MTHPTDASGAGASSTWLNPDMVARLRAALPTMIGDVEALVTIESPSSDPLACQVAATKAADLCAAHLGSRAELVNVGDRVAMRWGSHTPRVLLLGHVDTVWPHGTLRTIPWSVTHEDRGTILRGPGVFDMKVGAVQAIHALSTVLEHLPQADVALLLTTDEEIGSNDSKDLILSSCSRAEAALVLEPSVDAMLKNSRKGTSWYDITLHGRAAHAGLDPENGINAMLAMARLALAAPDVADPATQSTVTPTIAAAGTTGNTVPDHATVMFDVRAWTHAEQVRIDAQIRALCSDPQILGGATATVGGGINRQAMPESAAVDLTARLRALCAHLDLEYPGARGVGGASDGNITAEAGVPTLDGLGAVGGGAHANDEWALADAIPERTAMLAALIIDLLASPAMSADV